MRSFQQFARRKFRANFMGDGSADRDKFGKELLESQGNQETKKK